jgi:hypothetical protein
LGSNKIVPNKPQQTIRSIQVHVIVTCQKHVPAKPPNPTLAKDKKERFVPKQEDPYYTLIPNRNPPHLENTSNPLSTSY